MLAAHQCFFCFRISRFLSIKLSFIIFPENLIFPINFKFFTFSFLRLSSESLLEAKHRSKLLKTSFANVDTSIHLLNVFFVILPFIKATGIFLFLISKIKLGHISESTNIIKLGCHLFKKLFIKKFTSIGKYLCLIFL